MCVMKVTSLGQNRAFFPLCLQFFCCEWCQCGGMGLEPQVVSERAFLRWIETEKGGELWVALESFAFVYLHPGDSLGKGISRSGNLSSVSGTHRMEGETKFCKVFSDYHILTVVCVPPIVKQISIPINKINE